MVSAESEGASSCKIPSHGIVPRIAKSVRPSVCPCANILSAAQASTPFRRGRGIRAPHSNPKFQRRRHLVRLRVSDLSVSLARYYASARVFVRCPH